jgi:hypothetical protein
LIVLYFKIKKMSFKSYFFTVSLCFVSTLALGQQQQKNGDKAAQRAAVAQSTLITDRPDATESPNTVPVGFVQYEGGFLYTKDAPGTNGVERTVYNTGLFRIGLLDNLELRLGYNMLEEKRERQQGLFKAEEFSGIDPMLFGFKVAIRQGEEGKADIGAMGHVYLPFTASAALRPETTAADFRFSVAHTLTDRSTLAYNAGAMWGADSSEMAYVYTIAYGYSLSSKWGAYAELYGDLPENSSPNHSWDAGLTYLVSNSVQLDATIGSGISTDQEILFSAGVSVRLPR